MQVYKSETREILRRYQAGQISRHHCIAALDAAAAGLVPYLKADDFPEAAGLISANTATLAEETKRRREASLAPVAKCPGNAKVDHLCN
jgi:hypothetical protein